MREWRQKKTHLVSRKKKHLYSIFYVFFVVVVLYLGIDENTLTFTVGMAIHTHI
jgi:type IV secretory pathway component VirB8